MTIHWPAYALGRSAAGHCLSFTPALSMNSTPARSSASRIASTVRSLNSAPLSKRTTVSGATLALAASSLTVRSSRARPGPALCGDHIFSPSSRFQLNEPISSL